MGGLNEIAPGVLVAASSYELTTSTVVAGFSRRCLVIDPAVTVDDLSVLTAELAARGLRPEVGWSTHPHWDHVLWSRELGDVPRYASTAAVTVAETGRDVILEEAEKAAPGHDLSLVGRLTPLGASAIAWDGPAAYLLIHDGHAPGHGAVFLPDSGVLVAGDMCSDVEIPLLDMGAADPLGDYRAGLERLASLPGVRQVVPGHGHAGDLSEFRRRVAADLAYLDALELGKPVSDSRLEDCAEWIRTTHEEQVRYYQRLTRRVRKEIFPERAWRHAPATGRSSTDGRAASRPIS